MILEVGYGLGPSQLCTLLELARMFIRRQRSERICYLALGVCALGSGGTSPSIREKHITLASRRLRNVRLKWNNVSGVQVIAYGCIYDRHWPVSDGLDLSVATALA